MSNAADIETTSATEHVTDRSHVAHKPIPFRAIVGVELRKMFDTRSGFWLIMSVLAVGVVATVLVLAFGKSDDLTYDTFAQAIGTPMLILLPVIAILSVTGEWTQRAGLTTFALIPHRGRVIRAKLAAILLAGVVSMGIALAIGALGNALGAALLGHDAVWNLGPSAMAYMILSDLLLMVVGFMLGVLMRNSAAAIVTYFVYSFIVPNLITVLANTQDAFKDVQPWLDFSTNQSRLSQGGFSAEDWAQLVVTGVIWLGLPLAFGLWRVVRAEVK